ncbi:MAG: phosphatase PAP2 family protein [Rikenellaceae bacterium]
MKALFILLLAIITITKLHAKSYGNSLNFGVESLQHSIDSLKSVDSPSKFKFYKLIMPSSPIVIGSLTLYVSKADELDMTLSDKISSGHGKLHFDDYLQYSPIAIMWGLNALGGDMKPYHKFKQQSTILLMASLTSLMVVHGTKEFVGRRRPDTGASTSFPSGHTATAFMGAEMLHQEYGHHSIWISISGYTLATITAYMRVYNERHYIGDIVAGAGIGILSTRLAYWVAPRINRWLWGDATGYQKKSYVSSIAPCTIGNNYGLNLSVTF